MSRSSDFWVEQSTMNATTYPDLPALPYYELQPLPSIVPGLNDVYLALALPIIAYWAVSLIFHIIDVHDLFPQYRLHTPAEILARNHVSRYEVFRDVIIQQIIQTAVGLVLAWIDPEAEFGREDYDIKVWARRVRIAERSVPSVLAILGLDAVALADQISMKYPYVAGVLRGGHYPGLLQTVNFNGIMMSAPAFAPWELSVAKAIYWCLIPAMQFVLAICILDTWQYFWHRGMHLNKWLYTTLHSRHHRLYVPYAYGALYNHPIEGLLLDTLGAGVAYLVAGMTTRQSMIFFTFSTIKTVDDHCGYALPWDPLQLVTGNNAGYHDVHHQSWGIKTNFSQPFFTIWDRIMGTMWTGGDVSVRYARSRRAAEAKLGIKKGPITGSQPSDSLDAAEDSEPDPITAGLAELQPAAPKGKAQVQAAESRKQVLEDKEGGGQGVLVEEAAEEEREIRMRRSPRKKANSVSAEGSLKGLKDRVSASLHGGVGGVLVDKSR